MTLAKPDHLNLPSFYRVDVQDLSIITLDGEEQTKYLQGQVTCDVTTLEEYKLLHGSHCSAKGKAFSCFRLIEKNEKLLMLLSKDSLEASLRELNKFGVFAKVDIKHNTDYQTALVGGVDATNKLLEVLPQIPDALTPVVEFKTTTIVYLAGDISRYLIIDKNEHIDELLNPLVPVLLASDTWNLLEITQGFPHLNLSGIEQFVPQMLNMQAINGISFTKGCYLGQETVARMQYLGKNKKAMFTVLGDGQLNTDDLKIEKQLGDNWRSAGDVINHYQADSGKIYLQTILASDIESNTKLRIKSQDSSSLSIFKLPYSLQTDT